MKEVSLIQKHILFASNLEKLNLVELTVQEVEGGGLLLFPITGFICGYLYEKN